MIETAQTVLTAVMLAFIFRAFLVEAFIIPTGSMAESLLGAHATRTCPACGWQFDFALPGHGDTFCPNCHLRAEVSAREIAPKAGDRILVHKWPYLLGGLLGPRRWDVIVFRNPVNPNENYIKRLVGLPGETIEIVDGNVCVDGRIARKTPAAQQALWFVVFNQNHYPHPDAPSAETPRWVAESAADTSAGWSGLETRVFRYRGLDEQERRIRFDPAADPQYFQDVYAYNGGPSRQETPFVGDVRLVSELSFRAGDGLCRIELARGGDRFEAELHRDGRVWLVLDRHGATEERRLTLPAKVPAFRHGRPYRIEFAHLDQGVYLSIDGREVQAAEYMPDTRSHGSAAPVELRIGAARVELELRGVRIDRDVYYTTPDRLTRRAAPGQPFVLEADEYFVLGDNSPDSRDSREWTERGPHLPADYRLGTIRAGQIVGPAAFVYLPGLLPLDSEGRWRLPDLGRVRFVR